MTFTTRVATPADHAAFVRLFAELAVPDPVPDAAAFAAMLPRLVVATRADGGGDVVGYASWRLYGDLAHVVNVVTAPSARGRRVGQALMDAVRAGVQAEGARRWYLNVKVDNTPAIRLYTRCGFVVVTSVWAIEGTWSMRSALPTPPFGTRADAEVDAAELLALGLLPAQIGFLRERGRVALGLRDAAGVLVAFAALDPGFPGAYPFAARAPSYARALLDALAPHADPGHGDLMRLALEGDRALADALVAAGARLLFPLVRMQAELDAPSPEAPAT